MSKKPDKGGPAIQKVVKEFQKAKSNASNRTAKFEVLVSPELMEEIQNEIPGWQQKNEEKNLPFDLEESEHIDEDVVVRPKAVSGFDRGNQGNN